MCGKIPPHIFTYTGIGSRYPDEVTPLLLLGIILLLLHTYVGKKHTMAFGTRDVAAIMDPVTVMWFIDEQREARGLEFIPP